MKNSPGRLGKIIYSGPIYWTNRNKVQSQVVTKAPETIQHKTTTIVFPRKDFTLKLRIIKLSRVYTGETIRHTGTVVSSKFCKFGSAPIEVVYLRDIGLLLTLSKRPVNINFSKRVTTLNLTKRMAMSNQLLATETIQIKQGEKLKVTMNFSNWLNGQSVIASINSSALSPSGPTLENVTNNNSYITAFVSGAVKGTTYTLTHNVTTLDGQIFVGEGYIVGV